MDDVADRELIRSVKVNRQEDVRMKIDLNSCVVFIIIVNILCDVRGSIYLTLLF